MTQRMHQRRQQIMAFIRAYYAEHGYAPTYREIGLAVGLAPTTVSKHLQVLAAHGCITWEPHKPRTLVVVGEYR